MKRILVFFGAWFLLSYVSCLNEEDGLKFPRVYTNQVESITPLGARYTARIDFPNMEEVTDFGFIWGENSNLSGPTVVIQADGNTDREFFADVRSSLVTQRTYYVRSFVKNSGKTVYGNIVSFKSLGSEGPKITGLLPSIAAFGDTVRVLGRNFTNNTKLFFGKQDISPSIVKIEKERITFVLPSSILENPSEDFVSVSIEQNVSKSPQPLKLDLDRILPKIISIQPMEIKSCDTVTLIGKNFIFERRPLIIYANGQELSILKATKENIVCVVKKLTKSELVFTLLNGRFNTTSGAINVTELRPQVVSVSPMVYQPNDILSIKVNNFPHCSNELSVSVKGVNGGIEILSKSRDEVRVRLPEGCLGEFRLLLTFPAVNYLETLQIETPVISPELPEIYSIEPSHGSFGDEVIVTGKGLKNHVVDILDTLSTSDTQIRGTLNQLGLVKSNGFSNVTVSYCGYVELEDAFQYDPVEILDFEPKIVNKRSQKVTITGRNFSSFANDVTIGSYTVNVPANPNQSIILRASDFLPDITESVNESFDITIKNSLGIQATSKIPLQISCEASWVRLDDFVGGGTYMGVSFGLNGKGYISQTKFTDNFWQFDPVGKTWEPRAPYPGLPERNRLAATANGKAYVGLGLTSNKEWWQYDPVSNTWTRKKDYPGGNVGGGFAFEIGGKIYVGGGGGGVTFNFEFWEYNPTNDTWSRKSDLPNQRGYSMNFSFKGRGYVYVNTGNTSYENRYDPNTNTWATRQIPYFERSAKNVYMTFQDYVIMGGESLDNSRANAFLRIIPGDKIIQEINYAGIYRMGPIGFSIGNFGYWGLGLNRENPAEESLEIWRFDPSN